MELAIAKARAHGVGWVVCRGSNHFGAAGYWAEQAARQHLLAFSFTNTAPFMVPTGGRTRAVGTNPICCFAPGAAGESFQLDMSTTTVPIGKVLVLTLTYSYFPFPLTTDPSPDPNPNQPQPTRAPTNLNTNTNTNSNPPPPPTTPPVLSARWR